VETDTFGGSRIVLGEFELADRVHEINLKRRNWRGGGAAVFDEGAAAVCGGSMGPTTKLRRWGTLDLRRWRGVRGAGAALIEGGVDLLLIETCQIYCSEDCDHWRARCDAQSWQAAAGGGASYAARNRNDVAGHGDWRGADRVRTFRCRHPRVELRDRPKEMNDAVVIWH